MRAPVPSGGFALLQNQFFFLLKNQRTPEIILWPLHVHTCTYAKTHTQTHKSKETEEKEGKQNIQGEVTKSSKLSSHSCHLESTQRPQLENANAVGNSMFGDCHLITSVEFKFKNYNTRVTGCG